MRKTNVVDICAKIGDLKEIDYRNTLAIATIIEILIEKRIMTRQEFAKKAYMLDNMTLDELKTLRKINQ